MKTADGGVASSARSTGRSVWGRIDSGSAPHRSVAVDAAPATRSRDRGEQQPVEINGIAHIMLSVNDFAACLPFYEKLLTHMGLEPVIQAESILYCVGGRTAVGIQPADEAHRHEQFAQRRAGLHHVCFRAREREDVDRFYAFLTHELDARIVHPPEEAAFAPGYYSVLFEDPGGIRLEMNHVPGKGLLTEGGPKRDAS
jgi:catechol 2,3-dioxygenase-like lactoylglutathione lyase family enzyme